MLQALHMLLTNTNDTTQVVMLNGNKSMNDVLMKVPHVYVHCFLVLQNVNISCLQERLHEYAAQHGGRFKLVNIVGNSPEDKPQGWDAVPAGLPSNSYVAETGWIDEDKVSKYCFPASSDTAVFVCGLPGMYATMCGPRNEKEVPAGTALANLGFTGENVVKF